MIILFNCFGYFNISLPHLFSGFTNWIIQVSMPLKRSSTISLTLYFVFLQFFQFIVPLFKLFYSNSKQNSISSSKQHSWTKKISRNLIIPQNLFQCYLRLFLFFVVLSPFWGRKKSCCKIEKAKICFGPRETKRNLINIFTF
jgi:hypothetical protein